MGDVLAFRPRPTETLLATVLRLWQAAVPDDELVAAVIRKHPGTTQEEFDCAMESARQYLRPGSAEYGGGAA